MPALVAGIHVFRPVAFKAWIAGTSPAMTDGGVLQNEGATWALATYALTWSAIP
jgi:hypothetical protein